MPTPTPSNDLLPAQEAFVLRATCPPNPSAEENRRRDCVEDISSRSTEGNTGVDMALSQELSLYSAEHGNHEDTAPRSPRNGIEDYSKADDGKSDKTISAFDHTPKREDYLNSRQPGSKTATCDVAECMLTPQSMSSIDRPSPSASPSPSIDDIHQESISTSSIQTAPNTTTAVPNTPSPWDFSQIRLTQESLYHTSYLRPGSRFTGTQRSDRQIYNVDVHIQHVSIPQSFLCGYLRIQGLTEDHPSLTTYFEGELIGTTHTFITKHPDWGATEKIDQSHWERFTAFKPLKHEAKKNNFTLKGWWNRENIFMRWKEHFLVPDHRVRTITGASFEGFYYICYNQVEGKISGIYFHAKSEK